MSESDKAPDVPPAPTYTYGQPTPPPPAAAPAPPQQPRYGEYAPPGYVPPAPPPGTAFAPVAPVAPAGRRRRMWDVVLTIVLLVIGFFGMGIGILYGAVIGDRAVLDATFQSLGLDGFSGTIGAAPTILVVSHLLLYVAALGVAIPLLVTKRIAFWAPLAAGVIAAIVFWATLMSVFMSDPNFTQLGGM